MFDKRENDMAHAYEELIRGGYEAFGRGDLEWLQANAFDSSVTYHVPGDSSISGTYAGIEAVFGFFGRIAQETEGTFKAELVDVLANDHIVAVVHNGSGSKAGKEISLLEYLLFEMKDGKAINVWVHPSDQQRFDDFWS